MVYDGIKSPPFAPSRVGKDEILYKASSSPSSCVLNVTENIFLAKFNLALMLYFGSILEIKNHSKVLSEFLSVNVMFEFAAPNFLRGGL